MRFTLGTVAVLGLAVAAAVAQPPRERAAELKPPQALAPGELPQVARGAIDDFPSTSVLPSTPVTRSGGSGRPGVASGPAWLTGDPDPNVQPASGLGSKLGGVRPLTPPAGMPKDDAPVQPRIIDRLKGAVAGDKHAPPQPLPQPVAQPQQQQPTASTPFRGTGANGAPVFAGPPAYRWYGWGTVTPGANPLAPTGQYPRASANWYNITGATPGAFPVPVGTPPRMPSGTEPPNYGLAARPNAPAPVVPVAAPQPGIQYVERSPSAPTPQPVSKFMPPDVAVTPPAHPPAPPAPAFVPPAPPVSVPVITAPPLPRPVTVAPPPPAPKPEPKPEVVAALPPIPAPPRVPVPPPVATVPSVTAAPALEPAKLPVPVAETKPVTVPSPLPTSVTKEPVPVREEHNWQQSKEPATPAPGTWAPSAGAEPLPTMIPGEVGVPVGRASGAPIVARGQMGDRSPDPLATLIKQVCQGRADGVEVRFTGTKKLQVCFEVRTATEARRLVDDISKRPELTAYQVDFCVLVK